MTIVLTSEQRKRVDAIKNEPTRAALLADETGAGKTITALTVVKEMADVETVLVIAPLNTFDGWTREAERLGLTERLPVREILSKDKKNTVFEQLRAGVPGIYLIGREFMHIAALDSKNRKARWRWAYANRKLDVAIFDEIHAASNRQTATHKALKQIVPKRLKLALSATPGGEKFQGLWAVTRWLWPKDFDPKTGELFVDKSFWRWAATWAEMGFDPFSRSGRKVLGEKVPGAFVASLPCYFRLEGEKLPVKTFRAAVPITPEQRKQYNQMLERAIAWLEENPLVADLPIVQKMRLRQMLLGEVVFNEQGEVDFPAAEQLNSTKAMAALKIIEREGPNTPILFLVDSKKFALRLNEFLQAKGYKSEAWTGDQSKETRNETKARFVAGETKYIVGTISKALAEGTDGLQTVCSTEVWLNKSFSSLLNEQMEGRLNRRGQKAEHITRYEVYVPDSADGEDWERDARKTIARRGELTRFSAGDRAAVPLRLL